MRTKQCFHLIESIFLNDKWLVRVVVTIKEKIYLIHSKSMVKEHQVNKVDMKNKVIKQVFVKNEKLKKPKDSPNVLIVKHRQKESFVRKVLNVLVETYYEYADITKVNGMFYLRKFSSGGCQRMVWSCIMIVLLSFSATLVHLLYRRYLDSPTRVTIDSPMPINTIPFPAVTICHPQNVIEYKSKAFVKRM